MNFDRLPTIGDLWSQPEIWPKLSEGTELKSKLDRCFICVVVVSCVAVSSKLPCLVSYSCCCSQQFEQFIWKTTNNLSIATECYKYVAVLPYCRNIYTVVNNCISGLAPYIGWTEGTVQFSSEQYNTICSKWVFYDNCFVVVQSILPYIYHIA